MEKPHLVYESLRINVSLDLSASKNETPKKESEKGETHSFQLLLNAQRVCLCFYFVYFGQCKTMWHTFHTNYECFIFIHEKCLCVFFSTADVTLQQLKRTCKTVILKCAESYMHKRTIHLSNEKI